MNTSSTIPRYRMSPTVLSATATAYNRIADTILEAPLGYRDRLAAATVERMAPQPGWSILDIGCAAGSTALAAAERVGPSGHVVAVDLAVDLLAAGRRRAEERGLRNIEFICADMTNLPYPDAHFDGITSMFSVFFPDDIPGFIEELWRMLKPGGKIAIRTWGPDVFEPLDTLLHEAAADDLPHLSRCPTRMDLVKTPGQLQAMMQFSDTAELEVLAEQGRNHLSGPEDWWTMAKGSGLRRIIAALSDEGKVRVRERLLQSVREKDLTSVIIDTVCGVATKQR